MNSSVRPPFSRLGPLSGPSGLTRAALEQPGAAPEWSMNGDHPMIASNSIVSRTLKRIVNAAAILSMLALGACVDSAEPLLNNAEPILGQKLRVHVVPVGKEQTDPGGEILAYAWNGARYEPVSRSKGTQQPFTVHY